jgi:hypothetical protein
MINMIIIYDNDNSNIYNSEESINSITPTSSETETMENNIEAVIKSFPDDDDNNTSIEFRFQHLI